ncbi:MAG: porin, partial [Comamonas sp.]
MQHSEIAKSEKLQLPRGRLPAVRPQSAFWVWGAHPNMQRMSHPSDWQIYVFLLILKVPAKFFCQASIKIPRMKSMNTPTRLACAVFAIAGASSVAAQSSVQIYGRMNTSVEHQKHGDINATGLVSNSSFLGFQIKEDLGQGLKLGVVLEAGLESDTGSGVNGKG